jgi:hypothetical protein
VTLLTVTFLTATLLTVTPVTFAAENVSRHRAFIRGDSNGDGFVSFADITTTLRFLYERSTSPPCVDAADFNDTGDVDLSDVWSLLSFIYFNSSFPPQPYPGPDIDLTDDGLDCASGSDSSGRSDVVEQKDLQRNGSPGQEVDFVHFGRVAVNAYPGQENMSVEVLLQNKLDVTGLTLSFFADPGRIQLHRLTFDGTILDESAYRPEFTQSYSTRASEGYFATTLFLEYTPPFCCRAIPKSQDPVRVANLVFSVSPDAVPGERIPIRFETVPPLVDGRPSIANEFSVMDSNDFGDFMLSVDPGFSREGVDVTVVERPGAFVRGDSNADGVVDISDVIPILGFLFGTGGSECRDALDTNDDGAVNLTDAIRLVRFLFHGEFAPSAPFPAAGIDGTSDDLGRCW